jgi:CBS domain-containing protein
MTATARDLLAQKNSAVVYTCSPDATVAEASRMLRERRVGCLVVLLEGEIAGVVSEREVTRAVAEGLDPARARVRDVMVRGVPAVALETPAAEVERMLRALHVHHLPVVGERGLLGVVSLGDVARFHAARERAAERATG